MTARRAVLLGTLASTAALAVPAVASAAWPTFAIVASAAEHPNDKVRRLASEISEALNDPAFVGFRQVTITPDYAMYQDTEKDMPADERAATHFHRFADAMNELTIDAHGWVFNAGERNTGGAVKHIDGRWANGWAVIMERQIDPRLASGGLYVDRGVDFADNLNFRSFSGSSRRPVPPILTVPWRT